MNAQSRQKGPHLCFDTFVKYAGHILAVVCLLVLFATSGHYNSLSVILTEQQVRIECDGALILAPVSMGKVKKIEFISQRSMTGQSSLLSLSMNGREIQPVDERPVVENFIRSFGDWSLDRYVSSPLTIYQEPLPAKATIDATFTGRGQKILRFHSSQGVFDVSVRSGGIDNDVSLCHDQHCPYVRSLHPTRTKSIIRIIYFFLPMGIAALLFAPFLSTQTNPKPFHKSRNPWFIVLGCALLHFVFCVWFSASILGKIPHIPDSAMYYRQAILFNHGIFGGLEAPAEPAEAFATHGVTAIGSTLYYHQSNRLWPLLLSSFLLLGFPYLLSPLLSGLCVILLFVIARRVFGDRSALLSIAIYSLSPFAIILGGSFMPHTATLFFLLLGTFLVQCGNPMGALAGGAALAYTFGLRPLTTIGILSPIVLYALLRKPHWMRLRPSAYALLGAFPVVMLLGLDNFFVTGNYLHFPAATLYPQSFSFSNLPGGLQNIDAMLGALPSIMWSRPWSFFILIAAAATLVTHFRISILCWGGFLLNVVLHAFVNVHGLHGYGPRFLFESSMLLMATAGGGIAYILWHSKKMVRVISVLVCMLMLSTSIYDLVTILPTYRNYNYIDSTLFQRLKNLDAAHSGIVLPDDTWYSSEIGATLFDPTFQNLIFIKANDGEPTASIARRFPGRTWYRLQGGKLTPITILTKEKGL